MSMPGIRVTNKKFSCACGGRYGKVVNSRNRTGTARIRQYVCHHCGGKLSTVEIPLDEDLRSGQNAESVLRQMILEGASGRELLDALRWKLDPEPIDNSDKA